jgi:beta-glucosidase
LKLDTPPPAHGTGTTVPVPHGNSTGTTVPVPHGNGAGTAAPAPQPEPAAAAFPPGFVFGAATSAYQIEGAAQADGRGPSIWDALVERRPQLARPHPPAVACDHYNRYREDVALARAMGLQAYRFSISWPRVMPSGREPVNQRGLDFYRRLVDRLLDAGIEPVPTLFHWDLPQPLQREGGFMRRGLADDFAYYTAAVVRALGDRVKRWITLNEPWEFAFLGHGLGWHAPGQQRPWNFLKIIHHQLLAHATAVEVIRATAPRAAVGITLSQTPIHPARDGHAGDRAAAEFGHAFFNRCTLDPLLKGQYPPQLWQRFRWFRPDLRAGDLLRIAAPLDFIGINNYQRERVRAAPWIPLLRAWLGPDARIGPEGRTAMGWEIYPEGLHEVLNWLRTDYGNPPVIITENGAAFDDRLEHGRVDDPRRIDYLRRYLAQVVRALGEGCNVRGYFVWSLLDNFEWQEGFVKRFGLVHVDYPTQQRTVKASGWWYRDFIAQAAAAARRPLP